ncbi:MAG: N-acetylneuraminate synthase, partial [Parcubacteria group bacterium Gr01-1014_33]
MFKETMNKTIHIGSLKVGGDNPAIFIAELGVNIFPAEYKTDNPVRELIENAKKMIDQAVRAGAHIAKFQTFVAERLIRVKAPKAAYQDRNIGTVKSQFDMLKELELTSEVAKELKAYCEEKGIIFLSTAYDPVAVDELEELGVLAYKLASIETVNHPLIRRTAQTGKPVILSVGLANETEVMAAVSAFRDEAEKSKTSPDNLILLQCNTNYPAHPEDQNLRAMESLRKYVSVVGFSDHTEGPISSIAAAALGAKVFERHFTDDKTRNGPDHKASMEPQEFKEFVDAVCVVEKALGTPEIHPRGGELENITGMRKSICAVVDIKKGEIITASHIGAKRPGNGVYAMDGNLARIIGKKAKRDILFDENVTFAD